MAEGMTAGLADLISRGGPVMWVIVALAAVTLAVILWKIWRFLWLGMWRGTDADPAIAAWAAGDLDAAEALLRGARGLRGRIARVAMALRRDPGLSDAAAREEVTRLALAELREVRAGFKVLDVIATIAPLLGLLGTVIGMIAAFQGWHSAGDGGDPSDLAGGILQALTTTAAGLGVAIPAAASLAWFEAVADRAQAEMEDIATRIFVRAPVQGRG